MKKIYTLLFTFFIFCSCYVNASTVKFVQLSDIHYQPEATIDDKSFKLKFYAKQLLDEAIEKINNDKKIDFVVVTGDAADRAIEKDFREVYIDLNTLKKDWYYSLGNHDTDPNGDFTKADQKKLLNELNPKGFSPDKTYYSFKPAKDMVFIAIDSTSDIRRTSHGYIPFNELTFLKETLDKMKSGDVAVIYMHHPIAIPIPNTDHEISNQDRLEKLLKQYKNPILVLGGHFHATKIEQDGNIIKVASPALVSYPNAFRIITIDNKRDKTTFQFDYEETNQKDLQKEAKIRVFLGESKVYGTETDRNQTIVIEKNKKQK